MSKRRIDTKFVVISLFVIIAAYIFLNRYNNDVNYINDSSFSRTVNGSVIYLVYSPTCPHCHHLMEYLDKLNPKVNIVKTTDSRKIYSCLKKYGVDWDFGVPIMFANVSGVITMIQGYPSSSQDVDGYFLGLQKEEQICKNSGTPIYNSNGTYMFCRIGTAKYLGNMYSVSYLVSQCEKNNCSPMC